MNPSGIRGGLAGLFAQGATLGASFTPLFWGRTEALVVLVVATAAASSLIPLLSLAASHTLPTFRDARTVDRRVRVVMIWTAGWVALGAVAGTVVFVLPSGDRALGAVIFAAAVLAGGQTLFTVALAVLARRGDFAIAMRVRLVYGVVALALTLGATVTDAAPALYVLAIAGGYYGALTILVASRTRRAIQLLRGDGERSARLLFDALRGTWRLVLALTTGAVAGQVGALVTPALGAFAEAWAVVVRVTSGFQTVGLQIVGVATDIRVSRAVREVNAEAISAEIRRGTKLGLLLASVSAVVATGAAVVLDVGNQTGSWASFGLCAAVYSLSLTALAPIGRVLGFVGNHWQRLSWEVSRLAVSLCAVLLLSEDALMVSVALASLAAYLAYVVLIGLNLRRPASRRGEEGALDAQN